MAEGSAVLVIDDNIDDREVYRRMLARVPGANYVVYEAENGDEGIALNAQKRPDCVLLDYSLPGRDGVGVLEEILKLDPSANVIMLTGQGSETIAVEVMKGGARDYLTKDTLSPETLHRCIQSAIMHGDLAARLEQKQQSLEIFTRAMAHDLKEPLRTIKSFSRLLQASPSLAHDDHDLLGYVLSAADHMEELIVKVSGFSKLEASGDLEAKPVSLSAIVDQVERNLREQISSRGAEIERGPLPQVMGDGTLLVQMLQNIISNAIKYCEAGVPRVRISAQGEGTLCRIAVSDNGPGIARDHRELIFQPFKRLVGRGIEGTGLGLAICRRIAQLHGGAIWCEDADGGGTTFIMELPLALSEADRAPKGAASPRQEEQRADRIGRVAEVLLVEDSPADVQLLKIKLMRREKVTFNLHLASNGLEAMRLLQERATGGHDPLIDLILLDINMPIMDGFEVLEALSRDARLKTIPAFILSTSSDEDDMQRAKTLGARAYMVKPPTRQQLELALRDVQTLDLQPCGDALILYGEQTRHQANATI
ncbi:MULTISPECIES: response regulator [unclassified Rhizobium]|jgi:signal transduction histidine kinase|uniref:response regulator n=1 Tax=unclassified Rhizobium TaxID=2613769 RepID=UPI000DDBF460|nr:response regulator [Rhizobium sp. UBA1881]